MHVPFHSQHTKKMSILLAHASNGVSIWLSMPPAPLHGSVIRGVFSALTQILIAVEALVSTVRKGSL